MDQVEAGLHPERCKGTVLVDFQAQDGTEVLIKL